MVGRGARCAPFLLRRAKSEPARFFRRRCDEFLSTHGFDILHIVSTHIASDLPSRDASPNRDATDVSHLVESARNGDLAAFDTLVAQHQDRVYTLCLWQLRDRDEAADAAQETFVRAWRHLKNFRGDSAFSTWLHRIALNVTHDFTKKRARTPLPFSGAPSQDEDDETPEIADESPDAATQITRRERRNAVRRALKELPDGQRSVLVLFDIEGRSYEEAAAILELPMGTIKSRLNRARAALRDKLEACRELFDD